MIGEGGTSGKMIWQLRRKAEATPSDTERERGKQTDKAQIKQRWKLQEIHWEGKRQTASTSELTGLCGKSKDLS